LGIKYHVNSVEFGNHPLIAADLAASSSSSNRGKSLSKFENTIEHVYTQDLYAQCQRGLEWKERRKEREIGFLGIGTDWEKVRGIERETVDSCEELKRLGLIKG
jgi:DnaJ homolog subfamily B member 12